MQRLEDREHCDRRPRRYADDLLAVPSAVKHRLKIVAHRAKKLGAHVEGIVDCIHIACSTQVNDVAQILDVEQLIQIRARAQHRKIPAAIGPIVKELEDAQAFRTDKALGSQDGYACTLPALLEAK